MCLRKYLLHQIRFGDTSPLAFLVSCDERETHIYTVQYSLNSIVNGCLNNVDFSESQDFNSDHAWTTRNATLSCLRHGTGQEARESAADGGPRSPPTGPSLLSALAGNQTNPIGSADEKGIERERAEARVS